MSRPTSLGSRKQRRNGSRRASRLDITGLIVVAILILAVTITRYWHDLHWSLR